MSQSRGAPTATLVAIAKDEGAYILEWLAFHLAIGFDRILLYDNESTDGMSETLAALAARLETIDVLHWPSTDPESSPQTTAYNDAIARIWTDWTMFLDIDEFLVPFGDGSLPRFLSRVPPEASSVHVNWRGFGSSGRTAPDYGFVTEAFTRCAHPLWGNNHHFKSIARTEKITRVHIHNVETSEGARVLSDLRTFETAHNGQSDRIAHDGLQINHYQCKTFAEFRARMERGDANYHPAHRHRQRDASLERFGHLDLNDFEDTAIARFGEAHRRTYERLRSLLGPGPLNPPPAAAARSGSS